MQLANSAANRLPRRLTQLTVGLFLYGASIALMVRSVLGVDAWDVFHQGLSLITDLSLGTMVILVSAGVLILWVPLRQMPGFGTLANAVAVGLVADLVLGLLQTPDTTVIRTVFLATGIIVNGVATGLYIGAGLGAGPRDGLMTGLSRRTGRSIRSVRTMIELTVLAAGWALGGTVGIGTIAYALAIGPLSQYFIGRFSLEPYGRSPSTEPTVEVTP